MTGEVTKKVRMLQSVGGADYTYNFGQVVELSVSVADRYIAAGLAEEATEYLEVDM